MVGANPVCPPDSDEDTAESDRAGCLAAVAAEDLKRNATATTRTSISAQAVDAAAKPTLPDDDADTPIWVLSSLSTPINR